VPPETHAVRVEDIAWLSMSRVVVAATFAHDFGRDEVIAVLEEDEVIGEPMVNGRFSDLRVSPQRMHFVVRAYAPRGLLFFDRDGRLLAKNPVAGAQRAAWSPDERWTAVATGGSTYVLRTADIASFGRGEPPGLLRLPVFAADLAWR
jgi:hypothetical protein